MDKTAVFDTIVTLLRPYAKNQAALASPNEDLRIVQDLGVNSARLVDVILELEDAFGIGVDDTTAASVKTIGDAVRVILQSTAPAA